jgi:hypothetical protein
VYHEPSHCAWLLLFPVWLQLLVFDQDLVNLFCLKEIYVNVNVNVVVLNKVGGGAVVSFDLCKSTVRLRSEHVHAHANFISPTIKPLPNSSANTDYDTLTMTTDTTTQ